MKHDAVVDTLPIYVISDSAKLGYREKETWMKLDWNESPNNASPSVIRAINQFLEQHSLSYYPDVTSHDLIAALSESYGVPQNCISVFNGSDNALQHIFYAFLSDTSVFATLQPTYTQILQFVKFKRAKIKYHLPDDVLNVDYSRYESECVSDSDVVYIINPHNPTGHLLTRDYIGQLAKKNPDTLFVIDEAYMEFASVDQSCIPLVEEQKNIIVTRTFSKAYGLAGIRLGFAASHRENIDLVERIKNSKDINTLAQIAGEAAVKDSAYLENHIKNIIETREWFVRSVPKKYQTIDSEANFVLINYENDLDLIERLKENRVLVRDRSDQHGLRNFLRITVGTQAQMEKVAAIMSGSHEETVSAAS